jgi:hypothetical protein
MQVLDKGDAGNDGNGVEDIGPFWKDKNTFLRLYNMLFSNDVALM